MNNAKIGRRKFILTSVFGSAGLFTINKLPILARESLRPFNNNNSRIIQVSSSQIIDEEGNVNSKILSEMLSAAIKKFTNKSSEAEAWKSLFDQKDLINLKVNTLGYDSISGSPLANHNKVLTDAIIKGMAKGNIPAENFIIWDRSEEELQNAGYKIQKSKNSYRVMGCEVRRRDHRDNGFCEIGYLVGNKKTRLAKILTDECTALINIPVLKSHRIAGFTGALKNHYGSIHNAREFHDSNCTNPGIPEINSIPLIRSRQKLIIANALLGLFDGGPRWSMQNIWLQKSLFIGTDPVAVDTVMRDILDKKRIEEDLEPIQSLAKHIELSAKAGLGVSELNKIDLIKIEV